MRFYAQTDESSTESKAIEEIAFFPLMTMGIRPLGEVLTQLPVGSIADQRAGPPFEILHQLHFLPHKKAAWVILHDMLQQTGTDATNAANLAESLNSPVAQRLLVSRHERCSKQYILTVFPILSFHQARDNICPFQSRGPTLPLQQFSPVAQHLLVLAQIGQLTFEVEAVAKHLLVAL